MRGEECAHAKERNSAEPSADGSCHKKGCWLLSSGFCPNHPTQKIGVQYQDKWGMDNVGAGEDPEKCRQRAIETFKWCGMAGTQSVTTTYYGPGGMHEPVVYTADVSTVVH